MSNRSDLGLLNQGALSQAAGAAAVLVGSSVLTGWVLGIQGLKSVFPGLPQMVPNTALGLALAGASLWVQAARQADARAARIARACALVAILVGSLTLVEYLLDRDLGIDHLLFEDTAGVLATSIPGRPSPQTASTFVLLGVSLLLLDAETRSGHRPAQVLALAASLIPLVALIGYLYRVAGFYAISAYTGMALHTVATFIVLIAGVLLSRPDRGLMAVVTGGSAGSVLLRRLLPAAVGIPILLGGMRLAGLGTGLYDTTFGSALLALANIIVFSVLVWWTAAALSHVDARRRAAEERLRRAHDELELRVQERTAELAEANRALQAEIAVRRRAEVEMRLLQTTTQAVAVAPDFHSALAVALTRVCEATGWPYGEAWIPRPDGAALECSQAWYGTAERLQRFRARTQQMTFARGTGLPGRVWASRAPEWIPDVSTAPEPLFLRAAAAREAGLRAGVGVPIMAEDQVPAVLVFFLSEAREEEPRWVNLVSAVAAQLGSVILRKHAEDEVRRLKGELEQRVIERTAQLEAANKELEAFSYSVSHDLRAPLRAVDGFSRILIETHAAHLPPEARRYLDLVRSNTRQMGALIDDLLTFSRLSRQPLKLRPVEPTDLARKAVQDLQAEWEGRSVEFKIGDLPTCQADPAMLKQVFVNLLSNALKFTRQRETPVIEAGWRLEGGDHVYFVKDNGVGFDMRYADKLFGVFQRLHRAEEYEGTGVGLAIVQRIIHRHGGRVWAEADVDRGAAFYFTLGGGAAN